MITGRLWRRPSHRDRVVVVWSDEKMMRAGSLRGGAWQKEDGGRRTVRHETWTPQLHMWGCIAPAGRRGRAHRLLVRLPKVGAGKRGGVGGTDYLALLKAHLVPFLKRVRADHPTKRVVFMHDGAGPHRALIVKKFLSQENIETFKEEARTRPHFLYSSYVCLRKMRARY